MSSASLASADSRLIDPIDTTATVETPEHVQFSYRLAGPTRRAVAFLLDLIIRGLLLLVAGFIAVIAGITSDSFTEVSSGVMLVVLFCVEWGYYTVFETLWSGRTPGKRAMNIRVVREGGHPLSFFDSVLRNLLRAADFLPFGYAVGTLVLARDEKFRRLGDMVAGTMVVCEERKHVSVGLNINPPPTPQELNALPQRPDLSRDDLEAIELFVRRLGSLAPAREFELAQMVAPIYASKMGLRYQDPARFLALLYLRFHQRSERQWR